MCPRGYWDDVNNQINFLNWASKQLKINQLSDWYNVTIKVFTLVFFYVFISKEFIDIGGSSLLVNKYNSSIPTMLSKIYSEYEWLPWRFVNCPKNYWEDVNNQKRFMSWVAKELIVKEMSDWYKVTSLVTRNFNENSFVSRNSKKWVVQGYLKNMRHLDLYLNRYIQTTSGYHGDSRHVLLGTGTM